MNRSKEIVEAIRTIAGTDDLQFESLMCVVSDIDLAANTCTCTPIDGTPAIKEVILSVEKSKGFLLIPTDASRVECTQTSDTTAFISMVSDATQGYILGDANGGIVKVVDLVDKLNNLESAFNTHILAYNLHTHAGVTSGVAVTAITVPDTQVLTPTVRANIENTNVLHGNG